MLSYAEALALIARHARPLPPVSVPLQKSSGHVLARDIKARYDMPRFTNSAMDGVAVRHADIAEATRKSPVELPIAGDCPAGGASRFRLPAGRAVTISTGAALPQGVDSVIPREDCELGPEVVRITSAPEPGANVRARGGEYRRGDLVLNRGTQIEASHVAVLASQGFSTVRVHRKPRIAVVASGDELVQPGQRLGPGKIYDSSVPGLLAACSALGLSAARSQLTDNPAAIRRQLRKLLLGAYDVVIIAGGVSVGEHDLNREVLEELGVRQVYWQLAVRPGKPNYFGVYRHRPQSSPGSRGRRILVFGLPGNPVSVLVSYLKLVKPALATLFGAHPSPRYARATLAAAIRKKRGRLEWVRARLAAGRHGPKAVPLAAQGSHMLGGLAEADCLIDFPAELDRLASGSEVRVEIIEWGLGCQQTEPRG